MMKAATGPDDFTMEHIYEFKQLVSQELTKYVSSILLDEEYGFLGIEAKNPNAGLILSYEKQVMMSIRRVVCQKFYPMNRCSA